MACNENDIARLEKYIEARAALDIAYLDAVSSKVKSYSFDSGEGKQATVYRHLTEMTKAIDMLDSRIDWLIRKIGVGGGLVNLTLRRKNYNYKYTGVY